MNLKHQIDTTSHLGLTSALRQKEYLNLSAFKGNLKKEMTKLDKNSDGFITISEAKTLRDKVSAQINRDQEKALALIDTFITSKNIEKKAAEIIELAQNYKTPTIAYAYDGSGAMKRLSKIQKKVIANANKIAEDKQKKNLKSWKADAKADKDDMLKYMQDHAPIVICFDPEKPLFRDHRSATHKTVIDAFLGDTHYRNQFETKISNGSLAPTSGSRRDSWEQNNFSNIYHENDDGTARKLNGFERPKYGAVNVGAFNDYTTHYGQCLIVMKPGVRERTTFTQKDSSGTVAEAVSTFSYPLSVLEPADRWNHFKDVQLASTAPKRHKSRRYTDYMEAQIHGPVSFAADVESIYAPHGYSKKPIKEKLIQFCKKNNIKLYWVKGKESTREV